MKNKFYTFEGPEGSGKTTIIKKVAEKLLADDIEVITTREPGGVKKAEEIRDFIMKYDHDKISEAFLYSTARRIHIEEKIIPALERGGLILCDRFVDSSLAYQGYANANGEDEVLYDNIKLINKIATTINDKEIKPSKTFYFDIDPVVSLKRIKKDSDREVNRFDLKELSYHQKVCEGYKKIIASDNERFIIIDATKSVDEITKEVYEYIKE